MSNKAVAAKIIKAWREIGSIPKNGKNQSFNYKFVREEDAADALRNAFIKVGLSCVPSVEKLERSMFETAKGAKMNHVIAYMKFTLTDQDTGETDSFNMVGEAMDVQDKAVYKAITGCTKYAYVKLAMSGAEDNEDEDTGERTTKDEAGRSAEVKPINQGTTFRKPDEPSKPAQAASAAASRPASQPAAEAKPMERVAAQPADRPLSMRTAPSGGEEETTPQKTEATELPEHSHDVPVMEDTGRITTVVPAMKNKPASISFKRPDGVVIAISFDPKLHDVPKVLSMMNSKVDVKIVCDISTGTPHLMSIEKA